MSARIHGSEQQVLKIFSDDFSFTIPPYQRPYSWTTEQAGELLSDLMEAQREASGTDPEPYFLGSIVLIKQDGKPAAEVIDGQQRLTTLTILLAALRQTLKDLGVPEADDLTRFSVGDNFVSSRAWRAERTGEQFQESPASFGFPTQGIHEMLSTVPHQTDCSPTMLQNGDGPVLAEPDPQAQTEHPGQCHQSEESL